MSTAWNTTTKYIVGVILFIFGLFVIYISRSILPLLVIAALIAFLVRPIIGFLDHRLRWPRSLAVLVTYLLATVVILLAPLVLVPPVVDAVNFLIALDYQALLDNFLQWLELSLLNLKATNYQILGFRLYLDSVIDPILAALQDAAPELTLEPPSISVIVESIGSAFVVSYGVAVNVVGTLFSGIVAFIFMILASIYFSIDAPRFYKMFLGVIPFPLRSEIKVLSTRLRDIWDAFFRGQLTLMILIGVIVWLGLTILGLPGAFALGVISGVLELIPNLGPFLAAIPAVIVALLQGSTVFNINNFVFALIIIGFYVLVQAFENYIVVPKVLGGAVKVHPLVVISGVLVGASVAGILGALWAVPVIASSREVLQYLYLKIQDKEPFPLDGEIWGVDKVPEEREVSFRESARSLVDKVQEVVTRLPEDAESAVEEELPEREEEHDE
jgi:predicted PurR-regulated permease PerM